MLLSARRPSSEDGGWGFGAGRKERLILQMSGLIDTPEDKRNREKEKNVLANGRGLTGPRIFKVARGLDGNL